MLGYGYDDVSALRDMFDGGGAGQAGDEFQGGGILSLLANMLASPYGSQQEDDQLARTIAGQASPRPQMAPDSSMRPQMRAEQMTTGEELMSGDDVALPAYGGREEAFLLPGAFEDSDGVETALIRFRRGLVGPQSPDYVPLAQRIAKDGTPEQIAELRRFLEEQETGGGNPPLASTRAPGT